MRIIRNKGADPMTNLTRRGFIAATAAAGAVRVVPTLAGKPQGRYVLKLIYDKSLGMMRAVERLVP